MKYVLKINGKEYEIIGSKQTIFGMENSKEDSISVFTKLGTDEIRNELSEFVGKKIKAEILGDNQVLYTISEEYTLQEIYKDLLVISEGFSLRFIK